MACEKKKFFRLENLYRLIAVAFVFLFIGAMGLNFLLEIPFRIVAGWVFFLVGNVRRMNFSWELLVSGLAGWLVCVYLTHRFCVWWSMQKGRGRWKLSDSLRLNGLVCLLFASSCALVGVVHQAAWLMKERVFENGGSYASMWGATHPMKEIYLALLRYEEENGGFPDSLGVLVEEGYLKDYVGIMAHHEGRVEPYHYFGKGKSLSDEGVLPILASPFLYHDASLMHLRIDGSARELRIKKGQSMEEAVRELGGVAE